MIKKIPDRDFENKLKFGYENALKWSYEEKDYNTIVRKRY